MVTINNGFMDGLLPNKYNFIVGYLTQKSQSN